MSSYEMRALKSACFFLVRSTAHDRALAESLLYRKQRVLLCAFFFLGFDVAEERVRGVFFGLEVSAADVDAPNGQIVPHALAVQLVEYVQEFFEGIGRKAKLVAYARVRSATYAFARLSALFRSQTAAFLGALLSIILLIANIEVHGTCDHLLVYELQCSFVDHLAQHHACLIEGVVAREHLAIAE